MNIFNILTISISICMVLYYMYETDVVWEYLNKVSNFFTYQKWKQFFYGTLLIKSYQSSEEKNYLLYINKTYNNFTTRLISCPICFGFWISLICSVIFGDIKYVLVYAFISLMLYYAIKILTKLSSKI